jgi:isoquinoline 1-oxidoreductase beta subunit
VSGDPKPSSPTIFIRIAPDDTVHVTIPKSEMGQGVRTALALFVAEELDADWSKVRPEAAAYDPQLGSQGTGGSGSVLDTHSRLRIAGATMRQMLVAAAAQQLGSTGTASSRRQRSRLSARRTPANHGTDVRLRKPASGSADDQGLDIAGHRAPRGKYGPRRAPRGMLFASVSARRLDGEMFDAGEALKGPA